MVYNPYPEAEIRLTMKGIERARELLRENREVRNQFLTLVTNNVIRFMKENSSDPVKIILKILDTDLKLREDGLDWEEFLTKLKKTEKGYEIEEE